MLNVTARQLPLGGGGGGGQWRAHDHGGGGRYGGWIGWAREGGGGRGAPSAEKRVDSRWPVVAPGPMSLQLKMEDLIKTSSISSCKNF